MEKGGRTKRVSEEITGLRALGHDVKLITFNQPPSWVLENFLSSGDWGVVAKKGGSFDFKLLFALYRVAKQFRPDVIDAHCEGSAFYGGIVARLLGSVSVATVHRSNLQYYQASHKLNLYYKFVHGFIAVSSQRRDVMCRELAIPRSKIKVLHWGVDDDEQDNSLSTSEAKEQLGLPRDPMLLSVGHLGLIKGHDDSIVALADIRQNFVGVCLYIAGDGDKSDYERLRATAKAWGVEKNVILLGQTSNINRWLKACDVFLQPSHEEAFGLVFLEAGLNEKPTVATNVGGIPEIIEHGQTGLLVDAMKPQQVAQAVNSLLSNPRVAERLGAGARKRILAHFLLKDKVQALAMHFNQITASK